MTNPTPIIALVPPSDEPPQDAQAMLLELGDGESGFSGTPVGSGDATLQDYVTITREQARGENIPEGWVPSTAYWITLNGKAAGLLRLRHYLNEALRHKGGHIGYYVRPSCRGKGIAKQGLALALPHARALGETRVMLTTNPANIHSRKVIEAVGGTLAATVTDQDSNTGATATVLQFWIDT